LKPVYLQIGYRIDSRDGPPYDNIVEERTIPLATSRTTSSVGPVWFRGFGELQVEPGVFGRLALNFEYAGDNTGLRALEVGTTVDAYPEATHHGRGGGVVNKRFYLEFYLALQFGSKTIR
jgi:hypothetical protein